MPSGPNVGLHTKLIPKRLRQKAPYALRKKAKLDGPPFPYFKARNAGAAREYKLAASDQRAESSETGLTST